MLNSKQLIEITGISRATLNNYVALGILPSPLIKTPAGDEDGGRATRLGYFEQNAVDRIEQVQRLKKQGLSMAQIAAQLGTGSMSAKANDLEVSKQQSRSASMSARIPATPAKVSSVSGQGSPALSSLDHLSLEVSIDHLPGPAYMVNNNFELIWWNDKAGESFFNSADELPGDLQSRNLLKVLFHTTAANDHASFRELLLPHLAAGKKRLSQQALIKIYSSMDAVQLSVLKESYDEVTPLGKEPMVHFPVMLAVPGSEPLPYDLYVCFNREGIFFTYSPVVLHNNFLIDFLSKRNYVINELLKKRKPYLTDVAVMVADVQNSIKICSELPAEEYFELINNIWQLSEPIFRKYYGTYGKHAGDGMVYYFFPQPDCDYKLNAINCALELKEMMKSITRTWQARKGWFSDIFLNIGLNEGQEWFGSYHAGGHVEFTVLGESINYASRISDFARNGAVWTTKSMLNQISAEKRSKISFGITRKSHHEETVFVTETYATIGNLLDSKNMNNEKFRDIEMLPITEIRAIGDIA